MASQFGKKTSENIEITKIPKLSTRHSRSNCVDMNCPDGYSWSDGYYDCDDYDNNNYCAEWGDVDWSDDGGSCGTGLTANEACCACGGGSFYSLTSDITCTKHSGNTFNYTHQSNGDWLKSGWEDDMDCGQWVTFECTDSNGNTIYLGNNLQAGDCHSDLGFGGTPYGEAGIWVQVSDPSVKPNDETTISISGVPQDLYGCNDGCQYGWGYGCQCLRNSNIIEAAYALTS